jgi:DNA mismatch repair protein MutS2
VEEQAREYDGRMATLAADIKDAKRKALAEAAQVIDRANAVIERSVREIREKSASKDVVRTLREDAEQVKQVIAREQQEVLEEAPAAAAIDVGANVTLRGGGDSGEVVALSSEGGHAVVVFGNVKMRVAIADLEPAKRRRVPTPMPSGAAMEKPAHVIRDLDLRGMTGEEALPLVDKFIDDAVLAGLHRIDVIHGKGTGALRKKVTEFLSHHPRVKTFRLGEWNEGGTGATVVELTEE